MMNRRRLAGLFVAGLLALTGSAACQLSPGMAAEVGDTVITQQDVDEVVAAWRRTQEPALERLRSIERDDQNPQELEEQIDDQLEVMRHNVMVTLVVTEAGRIYAADQGLSVPAADAATMAAGLDPDRSLGLTEDDPYVLALAEYQAVLNTVLATAVPAEPSEEDQREVYEHLDFQGQPLPPFEEVRPVLTVDTLGPVVGQRDLIATMIERAGVRIQPGYELVFQVPVQLGGATSWLDVPLSGPAQVRDAG